MLCDMNSEKCVVLFGSNSPKMSVLLYMNSDKKCILFSGSIPLKASVLFDTRKGVSYYFVLTLWMCQNWNMNSKIIQLLFSKFCIFANLLKAEVLWAISISFLFTRLCLSISNLTGLILFIAWNLPCYLHFAFWLIKLTCFPDPSHY